MDRNKLIKGKVSEFYATGAEILKLMYEEAKDIESRQDPLNSQTMEYVDNFFPMYEVVNDAIEKLKDYYK